MKNSIIWLASYPKSGNTWVRAFLANYLAKTTAPMRINEIHRFAVGDAQTRMYNMIAGHKIDPGDIMLTLKLRNRVLRGIVANNADVNFVKSHNMRQIVFGNDMIPRHFTRSAVYIMRNPLDLTLSYARHFGMSNEAVVEAIGRRDNATAPDHLTVAQFLGNWSDHVKSWTVTLGYPVLVLRYEDLLSKPDDHFSKLLKFIGLEPDAERVERAIKFSSFKELRRQEDDAGFVEKPTDSAKFFAKGNSGQWKKDLDPVLAKKIRADHRRIMKKYNYLWN
ncbi:MAG: sulfotransferase domain-containing protein [Roseovarius sp.]|nr:sulfotransferase domain-containing protein [Roseovarius sp.]MCY4206423.1 sulfotransferase domain-containing protein [Roseovarius sp.]MCY4316284.1 sulfotransferase domain-containing protein [Roseovarius sp.]